MDPEKKSASEAPSSDAIWIIVWPCGQVSCQKINGERGWNTKTVDAYAKGIQFESEEHVPNTSTTC